MISQDNSQNCTRTRQSIKLASSPRPINRDAFIALFALRYPRKRAAKKWVIIVTLVNQERESSAFFHAGSMRRIIKFSYAQNLIRLGTMRTTFMRSQRFTAIFVIFASFITRGLHHDEFFHFFGLSCRK